MHIYSIHFYMYTHINHLFYIKICLNIYSYLEGQWGCKNLPKYDTHIFSLQDKNRIKMKTYEKCSF